MGNHHCEKFPQGNYNGEDTLHSNRRRSESSMASEDEELIESTISIYWVMEIKQQYYYVFGILLKFAVINKKELVDQKILSRGMLLYCFKCL